MTGRTALWGMIVAIVLALVAPVANVAAASTYSDPQGRFSFTLPDGYTPVQTQLTPPFVAGFIAPNTANASFTIQVRESSGTLDAATAEQQKRFTSEPDNQPGPNGIQPLTLGSQPAQQFDYFTSAQGSRFHVKLVLCINGGALYMLTFTAQEQDYDTLVIQTVMVLSSFTFLGAAGSSPSAQVSNGATVYSDPQGRFSFIVPIDFEQTNDPSLSKFAAVFDARSSGRTVAYFTIAVADLPQLRDGPSSFALANVERGNLRNSNFSIQAESALTVGGQPAYRFDTTKSLSDGTTARIQDIIVAQGTTIYVIDFLTASSGYDFFVGRLQALLSSFSFSATPNPVSVRAVARAP